MKKSFNIFFIGIILSCSSIKEEDKMIVSGKISDLRKGIIYLEKFQDTSLVKIDSFIVKRNGNFKLETKITLPEVFHIYLNKEDGDSLNDRITFFGSKGKIEINTRLKTFESSAIVIGSENHDLLEEYRSIIRKFNAKNLDLFTKYLNAQKEEDYKAIDSLQINIQNLNKRRYLYGINFANTHYEKMISPYIVITELNDANPKFLDSIYIKMPEQIKQSKYGKEFFEIIKRNKKILNE